MIDQSAFDWISDHERPVGQRVPEPFPGTEIGMAGPAAPDRCSVPMHRAPRDWHTPTKADRGRARCRRSDRGRARGQKAARRGVRAPAACHQSGRQHPPHWCAPSSWRAHACVVSDPRGYGRSNIQAAGMAEPTEPPSPEGTSPDRPVFQHRMTAYRSAPAAGAGGRRRAKSGIQPKCGQADGNRLVRCFIELTGVSVIGVSSIDLKRSIQRVILAQNARNHTPGNF